MVDFTYPLAWSQRGRTLDGSLIPLFFIDQAISQPAIWILYIGFCVPGTKSILYTAVPSNFESAPLICLSLPTNSTVRLWCMWCVVQCTCPTACLTSTAHPQLELTYQGRASCSLNYVFCVLMLVQCCIKLSTGKRCRRL